MDVNNLLSNNNIPKKNIVFGLQGKSYGLIVNHGTTIEQLLKAFVYKCDIPEILDNYYYKFNSLRFSYNGQTINCKNQTFIEKYFKGDHPKISLSF